MDDGNVKQQIGKAQPGSVLRNLLYRVTDRENTKPKDNKDWQEIIEKVNDWFGVELQVTDYEKGISTEIVSEYKVGKKSFDIISGGSGFHHILTLLAFVYGYSEVSTILFDEPDAHLHVNLQRQMVNYFKLKTNKQFIIATHSEEFIKGVEISSILSILSGKPKRVQTNNEVLHALSEIDNFDVVRTEQSPFILYVEGEDDERLLSVWAEKLGKSEVYQKFYPYILGGSTKKEMQEYIKWNNIKGHSKLSSSELHKLLKEHIKKNHKVILDKYKNTKKIKPSSKISIESQKKAYEDLK
jgi:hypothetical protein